MLSLRHNYYNIFSHFILFLFLKKWSRFFIVMYQFLLSNILVNRFNIITSTVFKFMWLLTLMHFRIAKIIVYNVKWNLSLTLFHRLIILFLLQNTTLAWSFISFVLQLKHCVILCPGNISSQLVSVCVIYFTGDAAGAAATGAADTGRVVYSVSQVEPANCLDACPVIITLLC